MHFGGGLDTSNLFNCIWSPSSIPSLTHLHKINNLNCRSISKRELPLSYPVKRELGIKRNGVIDILLARHIRWI